MKHRVWHLRGGIHPPENKLQSLGQAIRPMPIPRYLTLSLEQHAGSPSTPCISVGERVLKGQLIAESSGFISATVHAPTSGIITDIGPQATLHPSGIKQLCITIESDGEDKWIAHEGIKLFSQHSNKELLARIQAAGIIGMGGAGFPTAIKLNPGKTKPISTLIINGMECEPYITADDALMQAHSTDIVTGIQICAHILQPDEILIGIEDNKPEAIKAMNLATLDTGIDVVEIPTKYPSGGEKQLIKILTGKEVPTGGLPLQAGVIVQNIGTIFSIFKAIKYGEPLISRITTLTGEAFRKRGNVEVLIGTSIKDLLSEGQADETQLSRVIAGGPMMGFSVPAKTLPVNKTTNCIIAATESEFPEPAPEQACIRCGSCADICPVTLLPQQLYLYSKSQEFDKAEQHNIFDCIECGACTYVCPSHIPLVQYYRFAKGSIKNQREQEAKSEQARLRFEARQSRLEKDALEKDARKKARAKAAAEKSKRAKEKNITSEKNTQGIADNEISKLKTAAAVSAKQAVEAKKALALAEKNQTENLPELQKQVKLFQITAMQAKEALKTAQSSDSASPNNTDESALVTTLREQSTEAQENLKRIKKALLTAKGGDQTTISNLQEQLKLSKSEVNGIKTKLRAALQQTENNEPTDSQAGPEEEPPTKSHGSTEALPHDSELTITNIETNPITPDKGLS